MALICDEVQRIAPDVLVSVASVDNERRLRPLAAPGLPPEYLDLINGVEIGPDAGACAAAAWRGRPVMVEDIATDPVCARTRPALLAMGLHACWSTPVTSHGIRVLGTVALYYRTPRQADPWHVALTDLCQHLCTLALDREASRERVHQLAFYDA